MPKLTIDNIPVEVPAGTTVLEAARGVGIVIPHFCYHPALGSVGACRLCAMTFLDGPIKGVQMSCMVVAQDGMVVSTREQQATAMRKMVIEWLMRNHPHDCPVCDEGGECLLQDYTIAGGHSRRRYDGPKRTYINQQLGPHIEQEMNRCIQCYRCSRFYQEFAGGDDFGVLGSSDRLFFGRLEDGPLLSPFSGNLVDICPTGVFTDKSARFRGRYWEYQMAPSLCPHCSLGCSTTPVARYRELFKVTARRNDAVNGWFICDRGRFDNRAVNAVERPRVARIDGQPASWQAAAAALTSRLKSFIKNHEPTQLAIVASPRLPLEAQLLAARLSSTFGATLCTFVSEEERKAATAAVDLLRKAPPLSMHGLSECDLVAVVAPDLLHDGPMLALALRQAARRGARIFAVAPTPTQELCQFLSLTIITVADLNQIPFAEAKRPGIICGTTGVASTLLGSVCEKALPTLFLFPHPNTVGALLVAEEESHRSLEGLVAVGEITTIISLEADLPPELLNQLDVLAAADWQATATAKRAAIFLPTAAWLEMEGTYVNNEGRAQRFKRVMSPGIPLAQASPDIHPPHQHRLSPLGSDIRPAWRLVADLLEGVTGTSIDAIYGGKWLLLQELEAEGEGILLLNPTTAKGATP